MWVSVPVFTTATQAKPITALIEAVRHHAVSLTQRHPNQPHSQWRQAPRRSSYTASFNTQPRKKKHK